MDKHTLGLVAFAASLLPTFGKTADLQWHDCSVLPLEGRALADAPAFARLPERIVDTFPDTYSRKIASNSAGLSLRFETDASELTLRWTVCEPDIAWPDMTGVLKSGFDIHVRSNDGNWRFAQSCVPFVGIDKDASLIPATNFSARVTTVPGATHQLNFPAYNTVSRLEIGLPPGKTLRALPPRAKRPVVFYGTSITQGCAASRPGLAYVMRVGLALDLPVVNLGFSGHGRMTDAMLAALCEMDAACYVLDCLPNMNPKMVGERFERFLRALHGKRPETPIVCVSSVHDTPAARTMNGQIATIVAKLKAESPVSWRRLHVVARDDFAAIGKEDSIDGVHLNDCGMKTIAEALGAAIGNALADEMIDLGDRLEVLWDDHIVDTRRTTAARVVHRPEFAGVAMRHDAPWEGDGCDFHNILVDRDGKGVLYRMYYLGWMFDCLVDPECRELKLDQKNGGIRVCYAESRDGITWTKPDLGLVAYDGSASNNIIMDRKSHGFVWDNFMVFRDDNPACPPDERYKAVARIAGQFDETGLGRANGAGLGCFLSADGIRFRRGWTLSRDGAFDSLNVAFWDATRGEYHCYFRANRKTTADRFGDPIIRSVKHMVSTDFKTWSPASYIGFESGAEDYSLYTSVAQPYPRSPRIIVGFPSRYVERQKWTDTYDKLPGLRNRKYRFVFPKSTRYALTTTDCVFMMSRDGQNFHREEEAFMTPGPENELNWVYGDCYPARGLPMLPARRPGADDELALYAVEGHFSGKPSSLLRYALRQDGFVSRHAPYAGAKVVTRPFTFDGDTLLVNFATSARGGLKVVLRADDGRSIESDELIGDKVDRVVGFGGGSVAAFKGKPVTLEFDMRDADLYSFRFARTGDGK